MKQCIFILSLLLFSHINAQSTSGLGNSDPVVFTRYKIPYTTSHGFTINGSTYISLNNNKTIFDSTIQSSNNEYRSELNPTFFFLDESDDRIISFNGSLFTSYMKNDNQYPEMHNDYSNLQKGLNLYSRFDYKNYLIFGNPVYLNINCNVSVQMSENKSESNSPFSHSLYSGGNKYQSYSATTGIGFGKMRDVTPVVYAIRLQERLKQLNKINTDLPDEAIINIAQQFSRLNEYTRVHNRAAKYFWGDISELLSKNGLTLNDMNLYSLSYLQEVLNELKFVRFEGYDAGVNLEANYTNDYVMNEPEGSPRRTYITESLYPGINIYFDYSHQLNLNSQFSVNVSAFAAPNVLAHPKFKQRYDFAITPAIGYEITDRFVFTARDQLSYTQLNSIETFQNMLNILTLGLNYFIEDNISLAFNYNWSHTNNKDDHSYWPNGLPVFAKTNSNSHYISLGVSYYFDRMIRLF